MLDPIEAWEAVFDWATKACTNEACPLSAEEHRLSFWSAVRLIGDETVSAAVRLEAMMYLSSIVAEAIAGGVVTREEMRAADPTKLQLPADILAQVAAWETKAEPPRAPTAYA